LVFAYSAEGKLIEVSASKAVPAGEVTFKAEVISNGGNNNANANVANRRTNKTVTLYINGEKVGTKDLGEIISVGRSLQAGRNFGTPVSTAYKSPYTFTGDLKKVTVNILN
jgi:arylsulfatase